MAYRSVIGTGVGIDALTVVSENVTSICIRHIDIKPTIASTDGSSYCCTHRLTIETIPTTVTYVVRLKHYSFHPSPSTPYCHPLTTATYKVSADGNISSDSNGISAIRFNINCRPRITGIGVGKIVVFDVDLSSMNDFHTTTSRIPKNIVANSDAGTVIIRVLRTGIAPQEDISTYSVEEYTIFDHDVGAPIQPNRHRATSKTTAVVSIAIES